MADVSRNVVAVLLVLVVVISGLGTWNLLSTRSQTYTTGGNSDGQVSLSVNKQATAGHVQLTVDTEELSNG